jgi:hypothetical protein
MGRVDPTSPDNEGVAAPENPKAKRWPFWTFMGLISLDILFSVLLMLPILPWIYRYEGATQLYTFAGSMLDLLILSGVRIITLLVAFLYSFLKGEIRPEYPFDIYHRNGLKKSREELEQEALEQSFFTWLGRNVSRPAFACEFFAMVTTLLSMAKCLVRLNVEVGMYADSQPIHPIFWLAIAFASLIAVVESNYADSVCQLLGEWGLRERESEGGSFLRSLSSTLSLPLLANDSLDENNETNEQDEEAAEPINEEAPGISDISADSDYKAKWSDVLALCANDAHLLGFAFIFLLLAAAAQVYIPKFTGNILDALAEAFSGKGDHRHESMNDVPHFMSNVRLLIVASILGGVFSGLRGSIFTVVRTSPMADVCGFVSSGRLFLIPLLFLYCAQVGGRVNVRLRIRLMDSLLVQGKTNQKTES